MRLAIVAAPPLALTLLSIATLEIALHRPTAPPPDPYANSSGPEGCRVRAPEQPACDSAHALVVRGHITGGASHVQLAGPVIFTDVTTSPLGNFELRIPVDGNVCDLLPSAQHFAFEGDGMTVSYDIGFER